LMSSSGVWGGASSIPASITARQAVERQFPQMQEP